MKISDPIFVAGHRGLAGSAIVRRLEAEGAANLILRSRAELDLRDQQAVNRFFEGNRPAYVFLAAAKVGGILANATCPAEFLYDNLAVQTNVIHAAWKHGTRKLLFLGSSCIYPRMAPQPIEESSLLTGPLEPTNAAYAVAKIAGLQMMEAYRRQYGFSGVSLQPTNLYGPGDNFDPRAAHVLPALIRRFHEAREAGLDEVVIWGSGTPLREFLHVDDLADAAVYLMRNYEEPGMVNVGSGEEISIGDLARLIAGIVGYGGRIGFDVSKPDGTPRKLLDLRKLHGLGWRSRIGLREGIEATWRWYVEQQASGTGVRAVSFS
ncbi:MAG: GDP-L-fucose synthase [Bryobacteraceae bacterium]|nr:GDP-L-fucose synthase [Bryobacteraceae bacterium]